MKNAQKDENTSFSILMANFNNALYIEEAIRSVISQTYSNWELIIVDDCSDDSTQEMMEHSSRDVTNTSELLCLALNIYFEARGESEKGQHRWRPKSRLE